MSHVGAGTYFVCVYDVLPNDDDGEVQQVPPVPQVGSLVHHEAVRDDLHHALAREYHQENVLDLLLLMK